MIINQIKMFSLLFSLVSNFWGGYMHVWLIVSKTGFLGLPLKTNLVRTKNKLIIGLCDFKGMLKIIFDFWLIATMREKSIKATQKYSGPPPHNKRMTMVDTAPHSTLCMFRAGLGGWSPPLPLPIPWEEIGVRSRMWGMVVNEDGGWIQPLHLSQSCMWFTRTDPHNPPPLPSFVFGYLPVLNIYRKFVFKVF